MSEFSLPHAHETLYAETKALKDELAEEAPFQSVSQIFKLLGDSSRVRIFWLLCHCETCVINLSALVNMSSPAVSHHLKQLKAGGLLCSRRAGKEVYYQAADTELSRLLHRMIEETMEVSCPKEEDSCCPAAPAPQGPGQAEEIVRQVHAYLIRRLEQRSSIEALAHRFALNPTTLKAAFKQVYGESLAAHIKRHRMKKAAQLLLETTDSIAQIARAVGFESQSKFSAAFRTAYQLSPSDYRKAAQNEGAAF